MLWLCISLSLSLSLSLSIYLLISIFIHVYNMIIHVFLSFFLSFFPFSFNTSENFNVDLSFFLSKRIKYNIQTQLAHIANGRKSCSILQQFTGRKCLTLFGAITWRHPSHRSCLLDVRRSKSFLRVINVRIICKRLRYSQTFGGISSMQWRKIGRIWRIQLIFHRFLCVRIEIDQL